METVHVTELELLHQQGLLTAASPRLQPPPVLLGVSAAGGYGSHLPTGLPCGGFFPPSAASLLFSDFFLSIPLPSLSLQTQVTCVSQVAASVGVRRAGRPLELGLDCG